MPARHTSLQDTPLLEAVSARRLWSTKEGVGETSGQTAGSFFEEFAFRNRSGRRNRFSSFGADLWSAISSGPQLAMKSGPDVFADALVPRTPHPAVWKTPHKALDAR
jgi:hypothetical protein